MTEERPVSLREATLEDLPSIVAIEKAVHVAPWTEQHFREELKKPYSRFLVLSTDDDDERVLAYLVYWRVDHHLQILNLAVSLEHRGLGYAKALLQQVVREGIQEEDYKIWLEVRKSNAAAIALYQNCRYYVTQIRKKFYSNGEDALVMELDLLDEGDLNF